MGSINHTLLTLSELKSKGVKVAGIIFNGASHASSEDIIKKMGKVKEIGRIDEEKVLDKTVIKKYAKLFKSRLEAL